MVVDPADKDGNKAYYKSKERFPVIAKGLKQSGAFSE
jgi:hypothetical protein